MMTATAIETAWRHARDNEVVVAHSISSTVHLDYRRGYAHKTYAAPRWVRALYRIAFQAPFPYEQNADAMAAAAARRKIAGMLTRHWFEVDLVAPVIDVHAERDGSMAFVTQLVRGDAPDDRRHARRFLRQITSRFLQAGLPTWQVTPYNPRAIGNLIAARDGVYRIIDLESNLVAPMFPLTGIVGMIRQGTFPIFDDIDVAKLRRYLAKDEVAITASLGTDGYAELVHATNEYAAATARWHATEPRLISRGLRNALRLVDVPSWVRGARGLVRKVATMTAGSKAAADRTIREGIDTWQREGHLTDAQAAALREQARAPEVASALTHLGAHVAMSIPLRFPLGSIARPAWTLTMRAKAELQALRGGGGARAARREHTLLVAGFSAVPGLGAMAYMLSKPLRANRALAVIALDRSMRKLPARLYARLRMAPMMVWHAGVARPAGVRRTVVEAARDRVLALRPYSPAIGSVLAVNAAVLVAGGYVYVAHDSRAWFDERHVMNTSDALQLAVAGVFGVAAWRAFWRNDSERAPLQEAAGIMFWLIAGAGLVYAAADDYFTIHEHAGTWMAERMSFIPMYTNTADDLMTLAFGATGLMIVVIFKDELLANRPSSTLLLAGVAMAALMVAVDTFGRGPVRPLEFPAQVFGTGLLLVANAVRYHETAGDTLRLPRRADASRHRLALQPDA